MRAVISVLCLVLLPIPLAAQSPADLDALETRATAVFTAGQTQDAISLFTRLRAGRRLTKAAALEARALWHLTVADGPEDGALRAAEIASLPMDADLIVLAACRTQLGRILRGEGLLSLARSFMEAGARTVVATLWDVDNHDTRWLMRSFYSGVAGGLPPDEALRVAQMQMIRAGGALAAPKVWAGFQASGETRQAVFPPPATPWAATALTLLAVVALAAWLRR